MDILIYVLNALNIVAPIWVFVDARSKGFGKSAGLKYLPYNLPPFAWALLTFLVWFIVLPIYLLARGELMRRASAVENPNGDNSKELFGSVAGRGVSAVIGVFMIMIGAALVMFGFDIIGQASGKAGGGLVTMMGFIMMVVPGLAIGLIGVGMAISALVKVRKAQSTDINDTAPTELE